MRCNHIVLGHLMVGTQSWHSNNFAVLSHNLFICYFVNLYHVYVCFQALYSQNTVINASRAISYGQQLLFIEQSVQLWIRTTFVNRSSRASELRARSYSLHYCCGLIQLLLCGQCMYN